MFELLNVFKWQERWRVIAVVFVMILAGLLQLGGIGAIMPFLTLLADPAQLEENAALASVFDFFGFESHRRFLVFMGGIALLALVAANAGFAACQWVIEKYARSTQHKFSRFLLRRYLSMDYIAFTRSNTSDLSRYVLVESQNLVEGIMLPFLQIAVGVITSSFVFGLLIWIDPLLTLLVIASLGTSYAVVYLVLARTMSRLGEKRIAANQARFRLASESMGGLKELKALGRESEYSKRFTRASRTFTDTLVAGSMIAQLPRIAVETIAFAGILLIVLYLLLAGASFGEVVITAGVFAAAGLRLLPGLQAIYFSIVRIHMGRPVFEALKNHLSSIADADTRDTEDGPESLVFARTMSVRNVTLTYPERSTSALREITLDIAKGSAVAFVGKTGSGKTTLVDLILGLVSPDEGQFCVDESVILGGNVRAWRRNIGYVPQHIFLCDDTVANNIAFGVAPADINRAAVERAASRAHVDDFALALPHGIDTVVGDLGVQLSGGQRQRIGIARALYSAPEVMIMDEATSALDSVTESAVMQAIDALRGDTTLVLVAHRLATVERCDVVFVLEDGKLVAQGSYTELSSKSAAFRELALLSPD